MTDEVLTETRANVLVITINRPEAKNAVNAAVATGTVMASTFDVDTGYTSGSAPRSARHVHLRPQRHA